MAGSTVPVGEKPASRWEDFVDVFVSPAGLFRRRADGKFGLALALFVVASAGLYFVTRSAMAPVFDAEYQRAMAAMVKANPGLTAEQVASGRRIAETFGAVFLIVGAPIGVILLGAVIWLVTRLVGVVTYAQGLTIATYAFYPRLIESLVNALQANFMDERSITSRLSVTLGVGRLLSPNQVNPILLALAGRIDLFTLWVTLLIAVGIKVIGRTTAVQAGLCAALVWLIGAAPALYQAYRTM